MRAKNWVMVGTSMAAIVLGLLIQPGGSAGRILRAAHGLTPLQARLLSGTAQQALLSIGPVNVSAAQSAQPLARDEPQNPPDSAAGPRLAAPNVAVGPQVAGPGIEGGPANVVPRQSDVFACLVQFGSNTKVNHDCEAASDPAFHGRGQAQNETAIAVNPKNANQVIASANDYRFGDASCGAYYSLDGGKTWGDSSLIPTKFAIDPNTKKREYWEGSGDTAVAWDSSGTAYFQCMAFNRGAGATNNPDANSTIYVFRSDNKGASFDFPGSRKAGTLDAAKGQVTYQTASTATALLPLADKPYMAIDSNENSPFRDNIYVSWTLFDTDGTAKIFVNRSRDHGESWDGNVLVSRSSRLCPISVVGANNCDANQFSDPVVAPNGDLYVVWQNFNNAVTGADNRNQILFIKSTDGGATFSDLVKAADWFDLPTCYLYTGGQDFGRACVPVKAPPDTAHQPSVFRATNYPSMVVDPHDASKISVFFGSYINRNSKESNGCAPAGFGADGNNAYTGVNTPGACNNDILVSTSSNGGATFTGTTTDPRDLPSLSPDGDRTDQWWQWSAVMPDGTAVVSYYDRSYGSDESTGFSDITASIGAHRQRVTTSSMPPPTQFRNAAGHGLFFGDYSGVAASQEAVLPFWMDTRDIGVTSCPTDVRMLCAFGNDQDVFVAIVKSEEAEEGGDHSGG